MSTPKPRTILLVNDLLEDRIIIRKYLSNTNYEYNLIEANSKAQALEFIDIIQFDCIILDSLLTNLEVLRELSKPSNSNKTPVILLSDSRISETAIEALQLAGNDYLLKAEMTADSLQYAVTRCIEIKDLAVAPKEDNIWLKAILDCLSESIFIVNLQGMITHFNTAAERLSGWKASEAIGQGISKVYRRNENMAAGSLLSPVGRVIPVRDKGMSIQDSLGNIIGRVFILMEKTDRNHIAKSEDELISLITHEMRNPLNSILGYTRLMRMQNNLSDQAIQMLEIIERNGQTQLQFITDLLDTARILNGEINLQIRLINSAHILRDTVSMLRSIAEDKAISTTLYIAEEIPIITADSERLQQIFFKLISQAIKLTSYEGHVMIRLWHEEAIIHLQVINDGNGIAPYLLSRILGGHSYAEGDLGNHLSGMGLNLMLVNHLVELHGGNLKVESPAIGHGAIVTVSLPTQINKVTIPPSEEKIRDNNQFKGLRILVVETEPESQELINDVLTDNGAIVTIASSAKEAYELLTDVSDNIYFDLMIADINLPDEDGYSLIRKIRKLPMFSFTQLPAIALIIVSQAEDRIRCLRAGFQTHISKPIDPLDMVTVIGAIVDSKDKYD
jgi:signal transduction histidine kinase/CheY-like chemotaxis protein